VRQSVAALEEAVDEVVGELRLGLLLGAEVLEHV
jgi:hypothetical protein